MGKRGPKIQFDPGPYPCFFNCGQALTTKYDRKIMAGWEWFCGYGERPVHFCPGCRRTRFVEIADIRERLYKRPANYPKEFAKP